MTLAALLLRDHCFTTPAEEKWKYGASTVLFDVNVSIGDTLTAYAAPPVLMGASTWRWDAAFWPARSAGRRRSPCSSTPLFS